MYYKLVILTCIIQWLERSRGGMQSSPPPSGGAFSSAQEELRSRQQSSPFPPPPAPDDGKSIFFTLLDLLILDILYKWSHTLGGSVRLTFFTYNVVVCIST